MKRKLLFAALCVVALLAIPNNAKADDLGMNAFSNVAGAWGGSGGVTKDGKYLVERYYGNSRPEGMIMAQAVSSVPNGTYDVEVYAHACHANGVGGDFVASNNTLSVNGSSQTVATIDNSAVDNLPMTVYKFTDVQVTDGTMNISFRSDAAGANWFTIRVKSVTWKGSYEDKTSLLQNADISDQNGNNQNITGWTSENFVSHVNNDEFNGTFAEMWRANNATMPAGSLKQTVSLEPGIYVLSANMRARRITSYLFASIGDKEQKHVHVGNDGVGVRSLTFVVENQSDVTLGFKHSGSSTTGSDKWVAVDDFRLIRIGDVGEISLTSQIANPSFETGDLSLWTNGDMEVQTNMVYNDTQGHIYAQRWHSAGEKSLKQTLSGLPVGKYQLTANAQSGGGNNVKLYVGSQEKAVTDMADYSIPFICNGEDVEIGYVGTGTATSWLCVDNFRLTFCGICIANKAVALPSTGEMVADTWYYFDVDASGAYLLTATEDLNDIVYTTDGTILFNQQVTDNFDSSATLEKTRYYVKSASAQTLTYEIDAFDLTAEIEAYNAAVEAAATAKTNADAAEKVNAEEYTALTTAIANYTGENAVNTDGTQNSTMKAALEEATAALTTATNAINTSITAYAHAKEYLDAMAPVVASTNFYSEEALATNYPLEAYNNGTLPDNVAGALTMGNRVTGNLPALLLSAWKVGEQTAIEAGVPYINTWSNEGESDGTNFKTPFFEYWTQDVNSLDAKTFVATLAGLDEDALYSVDVWARVRQRNGNAKVDNSITLQVGEGTAIDLTQGTHVGMTRFFHDKFTAYGRTDSDGKLTITITVAANSNISWLSFRDLNYARANDATALAKAVARVTALNGHVPTNIYDTAKGVVEAYTTPSEDAVTAVVNAAIKASAYTDAYAAYLELNEYAVALVGVDNDNPTENNTLSEAIETAATEISNVTSVENAETVNSTLKKAMVTYVGVASPVGDGKKFNLTFMLAEPNLDGFVAWENATVNGITGWSTEQEDGNRQVMENTGVECDKGAAFFEYWSHNAKANDKFTLYTATTLPEGTYTMSCYAFARQQDGETGKTPVTGVYFYANDTQGDVVSDQVLTQKSISFVNSSTEPQEVKIGLKSVSSGNTYNWMGIGYVELYKVPAQTYTVGSGAWDPTTEGAGDVTVNRKINGGENGWNAICFPFSMTQAEVEQYFGKGSVVKLVKKFDSEKEHLSFETRDGIVANQPCLLKATEASENGLTISGRTIVAVTSDLTYTGTDVTMTGCYAEQTNVPENGIFVQGGKLVYNEGNGEGESWVYSTRAYIVLNGWTPSNGIKGLNITGLDDEATGIAVVENGELRILDGQAYDLSGRAVKNPTKGLYIINGQKVFLK